MKNGENREVSRAGDAGNDTQKSLRGINQNYGNRGLSPIITLSFARGSFEKRNHSDPFGQHFGQHNTGGLTQFADYGLWTSTRLRLFILSILMTISTQGCLSSDQNRDKQLEHDVIATLMEHKNDQVNKLSLEKIFGNEWHKICVQGPYTFQDQFEDLINERLDGYEYLDNENINIIWIFYRDGNHRFIKIPRWSVMDHLNIPNAPKQQLCAAYSNPYIYLKRNHGSKQFYFSNTGE